MSVSFHVIIPARLNASRFPRKLLQDLDGLSVIERVYRQAQGANSTSVTIATDSEEILTLAQQFGANAVLTDTAHLTGTDRITEAAHLLQLPDDAIVVNLQGDEPFMPSEYVHKVAQCLATSTAPMATLSAPITSLEVFHQASIAKVVVNCRNEALYFSRAAVPHLRETTALDGVRRHLGIYAYRASFLKQFAKLPPAPYEQIESLEQLRALWHGFTIQVALVDKVVGLEINTPEDLEKARALFLCPYES